MLPLPLPGQRWRGGQGDRRGERRGKCADGGRGCWFEEEEETAESERGSEGGRRGGEAVTRRCRQVWWFAKSLCLASYTITWKWSKGCFVGCVNSRN